MRRKRRSFLSSGLPCWRTVSRNGCRASDVLIVARERRNSMGLYDLSL